MTKPWRCSTSGASASVGATGFVGATELDQCSAGACGPGEAGLERTSLPYGVAQGGRQQSQVHLVQVLGEEASRSVTQGSIALNALEPCAREPLSVEGDGEEPAALSAIRGQQVEDDLSSNTHTPKVHRHQVEVILRRSRAGRNHNGRKLLGR